MWMRRSSAQQHTVVFAATGDAVLPGEGAECRSRDDNGGFLRDFDRVFIKVQHSKRCITAADAAMAQKLAARVAAAGQSM